eukprot:gene32895-40608_t
METSSATASSVPVSSATPAAPAEVGVWEEKFSKEKNKKFWKNTITGKSQWTEPVKATPVEAVAPSLAPVAAAVERKSQWTEPPKPVAAPTTAAATGSAPPPPPPVKTATAKTVATAPVIATQVTPPVRSVVWLPSGGGQGDNSPPPVRRLLELRGVFEGNTSPVLEVFHVDTVSGANCETPSSVRVIGLNELKAIHCNQIYSLCEDEPRETISKIMLYFKPEQLPAGTVLWSQGQLSERAVLLVSGKLISTLEEESKNTEIIKPGHLVGEYGLINKQRRQGTLTAVEDCSILTLSALSFDLMVKNEPRLAFVLSKICMGYLGHRVMHVANRI